ncbi:MAG: hypothetical protein JNJ58_11250 [Chitinophagaceae bacterium]|nr:hypothetical protein [Chitinophagaceae bacterium]
MKSLQVFVLLSLILSLTFSGCGTPSKDEQIRGDWNFIDVSMASGPVSALNPKVKDQLKGSSMHFNADHTFSFKQLSDDPNRKEQKGTYYLSKDEKFVFLVPLKETPNQQTQQVDIVSLSKDSMTLIMGKSLKMVFSR